MTNIINIPLNKLTEWKGNVRKTQNKAGIDELAASIKAHGLQQNLVVREEGKVFAVIAGARRLKALRQLAKDGVIDDDHPVPCKITAGDEGDTEISLAENVMREDMHPADQFEAFRKLAEKGASATDIGARFGKSEAHVNRLLKLARVSKKILKAYRAGELALEDVMAFAVTDDHDAQERVLAALTQRHGPREIRAALTENDIHAADRRVKFVTLTAYENAGGGVRRDLFSDDDSGIYLEDAAVLGALVIEALERKAKPVRAEGWKWVEVCMDFGYEESAAYERIRAEPVPLTAAEQKKLDDLQAEYDALDEAWSNSDEDDAPARLETLEKLIAEIDDRECIWTPEQLAIGGAVVTIDYKGKAKIERGLVRPEDMPKKNGKAKAAVSGNGEAALEGQAPALSSALVESLTAHKSAAIAAELSARPDIALAAVVHAMACRVLRGASAEKRALQIDAKAQSLHRVEGSKAFERMEAARQKWRGQLPAGAAALFAWCLEQKQEVLLDLLAFCAAATVNAVQGKADKPEADRLQNAQALASALRLDMKAWFAPDAANYFSRVAKPHIFAALQEARNQPPAPAWAKLNKTELAQLAERELAGKGWLPDILRPAA